MKKLFPNMLDRPEGPIVAAGFLYGLAAFVAVFFFGFMNKSEAALLAALSVLPLPEMELQMLAGEQIFYSPILGTVCMVLLVPVSVSCLYYAVGFAPLAEKRPWMGYAFLMLVAAIPRIVNMLTFWAAGDELVLYLFQLPVHLIACWTYQKTDTVWTPMLTLAGANLAACLCRLALFGAA